MAGSAAMAHQGEEGAEECDGAKVGDVHVHVVVLLLGEQRVVALDAAALHVLVPAGLNVGFHQRSFTLARRVELQLLHLVLHGQVEILCHPIATFGPPTAVFTIFR